MRPQSDADDKDAAADGGARLPGLAHRGSQLGAALGGWLTTKERQDR